jgi:hypothetical protein
MEDDLKKNNATKNNLKKPNHIFENGRRPQVFFKKEDLIFF